MCVVVCVSARLCVSVCVVAVCMRMDFSIVLNVQERARAHRKRLPYLHANDDDDDGSVRICVLCCARLMCKQVCACVFMWCVLFICMNVCVCIYVWMRISLNETAQHNILNPSTRCGRCEATTLPQERHHHHHDHHHHQYHHDLNSNSSISSSPLHTRSSICAKAVSCRTDCAADMLRCTAAAACCHHLHHQQRTATSASSSASACEKERNISANASASNVYKRSYTTELQQPATTSPASRYTQSHSESNERQEVDEYRIKHHASI